MRKGFVMIRGIHRYVRPVVLAMVLGIGAGAFVAGCEMQDSKPTGPQIGMTVAEVEKIMGPPISVLPNFGREQRFYKRQDDGKKFMVTFEEDKVVEIN